SPNDLKDVEFWVRTADRVRRNYSGLTGDPFRRAVVRELLAWQASDLLDETARRIAEMGIRSLTDVREASAEIVSTSAEVGRWKKELERFLHARVYKHHLVLRMTANGDRVLRALFAEYRKTPALLPERHLRRWTGAEEVIGPPLTPPLPG